MFDDIATLTATPRTVLLGGEPHQVTPLSIADLGVLQAWVDAQFPNPFDIANTEIERGRVTIGPDGKPASVPYSVAQQQFLLETAARLREKGQRLIGGEEATAKLQTVEGTKQLLLISLRKTRPEFTLDDADALFKRMTLAEVSQLVILTNLDMVLSDPKAPTPSGAEPPARNRKERRRNSSTGGRSTTRR